MSVKKENLIAEIWLPIQYSSIQVEASEAAAAAVAVAVTPDVTKENQTKFERSISGKNAHTSLNCSYLPYLLIDITLPCAYPSESKPIYQLKCSWLNMAQLNQVCSKLDEIWNENYNMPGMCTLPIYF